MTDRLKVLADSYLDHIQIAVEAQDRGAPFRDFLDNWNAFNAQHEHHRSRGDRPRWFNNPSHSHACRCSTRLIFDPWVRLLSLKTLREIPLPISAGLRSAIGR